MAQGSYLSESYRKAFIHFADPDNGVDGDWSEEQKSLVDILRYTKNYEGKLARKSEVIDHYRFSDEREWRYVPPFNEDCEMVVSYSDYVKQKQSMDHRLEGLRLKFEPDDIKYIVIDNDSEIREFINHLRNTKGSKYAMHDVERLTTRILTAQQIEDDI